MSKPHTTPLLSVVISAHHEGIILHKTLRSVARATKSLSIANIRPEVIITVDNGDEETTAYLERQTVIENISVYHTHFRDLGKARNFGIKKSTGLLVATLDGDDLVSKDWFVDGVRFLQDKKTPTILHTEWSVNFGTQDIAWRKHDSRSKEEDAIIMVWANRWDSAVIAPREIFEQFPYASNSKGFGSEDWHFNSQTLAAGIPHVSLPNSALFVRRKDISEMTIQKADYRTVHYTDLLDLDFIKQIDIGMFNDKNLHFNQTRRPLHPRKFLSTIKPALKKGYALAYAFSPLQKPLRLIKRTVKRTSTSAAASSRFPAWLLEEWRSIHKIEKQLFPSRLLTETIPIYQSEIYDLGLAFHEVATHITKLPDYIIAVPHLVSGGADLVILNYVRALKDIHPDWKISLIATDNTESPWSKRLPSDVDFVPFGQICARRNIPAELQLQLFARLIVQTKSKSLHIIQSALAFEFAAKYKSLLIDNVYTVYACAFCEDIDTDGRFVGHIHSGLPGAYSVLRNVLTDNQAVINQLVSEYGYDAKKFITHYQPAEISPVKSIKQLSPHNGPYRILWASRIAKQKRPDIVRAIAKKLDPSKFIIDVYGNRQDGYSASYFDGIPGLYYKGGFNGLESLALSEYDVFLYTSANDGVPNILLGMAAMGLPIIAPDRGGISEIVINNETGILIPDLENIDGYITALETLSKQPQQAHKLAVEAHKLVAKRHSYVAFRDEVKKLDINRTAKK
jgi:glycosyltransferase involved in cell wall biosynthesis